VSRRNVSPSRNYLMFLCCNIWPPPLPLRGEISAVVIWEKNYENGEDEKKNKLLNI
jgi:hypothetical protein